MSFVISSTNWPSEEKREKVLFDFIDGALRAAALPCSVTGTSQPGWLGAWDLQGV